MEGGRQGGGCQKKERKRIRDRKREIEGKERMRKTEGRETERIRWVLIFGHVASQVAAST